MRIRSESFRLRNWLLLLIAPLLAPSALSACTLWGAAGEEANGGTIISKNRDWKPDHVQVLEIRRSPTNYAYLGLYAVGNDAEGIKQGINERGLTVVTATAGSIPKSTREAQTGRSGVMTTLLQRYARCDQILGDKEQLFSGRKPQFLMISDRKKILVLEVGLKGRFSVKVVESGVTAHSNHFLDDSLSENNLKIGESSATRVGRINELLKAAPKPLDLAAFAVMSCDRHDGSNNSLWRTGSSGATLSSWIVETPREGAAKLRVVIANPGQPEQTNLFVLDETFWKDHRFENQVAKEKAKLQKKSKRNEARNHPVKGQKTIRVALYEGPATGGKGPVNLLKQLNHAPEFTIANISPQQLQDGALTNYDVVIFAGGSASKQASTIGPKGRAAVQHFVQTGGGYIGICAGAYLATCGSTNSRLNMLDAMTISPKWQRGTGNVEMELTEEGKKIIGQPAGSFAVRYANGPIVKPAERADLPDYKPLAFFRTELALNGSPVGIMVNAPSVFTGTFGHGRVAAVSPHPEQTEGLEHVVPNLVSWAARTRAD